MTIPNGCSPSTTFVWKKVKIQAPPRPQGTARAQRARMAPERKERDGLPRQPIGVLVQYRGGSEAWWEITYAGVRYRIEGYHHFHDVMRWVYEGRDRPHQSRSATIPDDSE